MQSTKQMAQTVEANGEDVSPVSKHYTISLTRDQDSEWRTKKNSLGGRRQIFEAAVISCLQCDRECAHQVVFQ